MTTNSTFQDTSFVLRKAWDWCIVDQDGEIEICRLYSPSVRRTSQFETLTENIGETDITAVRIPVSETFMFNGGYREGIAPILRNALKADGKAPTITTYKTLKCFKRNVRLSALKKRLPPFSAGIPQTHDNNVFPKTGTPVLAAGPGSGTFTAVAQFGWIVPVYANLDPQHGIKSADFTLANWATFVRGIDYTLGTPSSPGTVTLGAPDDINVTWTDAASGPRPTHYLVVISTVNDILNAAAKVSAVVAYGAGNNTTPTALGATVFGTSAPSLSNMSQVQNVTVSASTRVYGSALSATTDYTIDLTTGSLQRVSGGTIPDGGTVRLTFWYLADASEVQYYGGNEVSELYKYVRLYNVRASAADPAARFPRGEFIDFPRVNFAKLANDLITTGDDAFHGVVNLSDLEIEKDPTNGYFIRSEAFADFANLIDFFSTSISPAARPVAW